MAAAGVAVEAWEVGGTPAEGDKVGDPSMGVAPRLLGFALERWDRRTELSDGRCENPECCHRLRLDDRGLQHRPS